MKAGRTNVDPRELITGLRYVEKGGLREKKGEKKRVIT